MIATLPFLGQEVFEDVQQAAEFQQRQEQVVLRTAIAQAQETQNHFDFAQRTLGLLSMVPEIRDAQSPACGERLVTVANAIPGALILARVDAQGTIVCANQVSAVGVGLADRAYIQKAFTTGRPSVSGFQIGRVSQRPSIALAQPLVDAAGSVTGLVLVSFDLASLAERQKELVVIPGSRVTLLSEDGHILFTSPDIPDLAGRMVRDHPLATAVMAAPQGLLQANGFDGVPRRIGHARIGPPLSAHILVSIPERSLRAAIVDHLLGHVPLSALAVLLALTGITWVAQRHILGPLLGLMAAVRQFSRDGQPIRWSSGPLRELAELGTAITVMTTDLSRQEAELKSRQEDLEQSNHRLADVIDAASDWFWETDSEHRFSFMSSNIERVFGTPVSSYLGRTRLDLFTPEDRADEAAHRHWLDLQAHRPFRNVRFRHVRADGRLGVVQTSGKPRFAADGAFLGYRGSGSDVTMLAEREQAMARLAEENAGLAEVVRQIPYGVVITDQRRPGHPVVFVNPAFTQVTGYDPSEVIGRNCGFLHRDRLDQSGLETIRGAIQRAEPAVAILENFRKDGTRFWNELRIGPVFGPDGELVAFAGIQADVTARIEADQRSREQERRQSHGRKMEALGTLAGGIAHDFNNLLVPILALTQLARRRQPADSQEARNLETVVAAADRARQLVRQILDFSRQDAGLRVSLDLRATIQEAIGLMRSSLPPTITLVAELPPDAVPVVGNATKLHQIMVNLCTNAAQAIGERRGAITVRLYGRHEPVGEGQVDTNPPRRQIVIEVEDDGCGMDQATQARIFDPFFTTKVVGEGTGLGLATVHGIVEVHGGSIDVESHPGAGSRFRVLLPQEGVP